MEAALSHLLALVPPRPRRGPGIPGEGGVAAAGVQGRGFSTPRPASVTSAREPGIPAARREVRGGGGGGPGGGGGGGGAGGGGGGRRGSPRSLPSSGAAMSESSVSALPSRRPSRQRGAHQGRARAGDRGAGAGLRGAQQWVGGEVSSGLTPLFLHRTYLGQRCSLGRSLPSRRWPGDPGQPR